MYDKIQLNLNYDKLYFKELSFKGILLYKMPNEAFYKLMAFINLSYRKLKMCLWDRC